MQNEPESIVFNPEQLRAINHLNGPALVVAGAGTGKTAVITRRIAKLILSKKAKPDEVLALTFTEKAAAEMQQRVDEMLPYGYLDTQIMTFHALAEKILREYALDIGLSTEFQILTDIQQTIVLQEILSGIEYKYFSPQHDPFDFIGGIKQAISRLKDEGIDFQKFEHKFKSSKKSLDEESLASMRDFGEIYNKYTKLTESKNSLDFGDMLIKLHHLLYKHKRLKKEIVARYKYVLVDEFQDTNSIQMKIIESLLDDHKNIMVVGDDDQAIYRFRGASVANILSFRKIFKQSKIFVLKQNYRSGQAILDAGYRLIQHNNPDRLEYVEKIEKKLQSKTHPDAKIKLSEYAHKMNEVDGVVAKTAEFIEDGVEPSQIAILLRKNNQLKAYILALQKQKIPYYVHQDVELFDQKSVKLMVNLTRVICDPNDSAGLFQLLVGGFFKNVPVKDVIELSSGAKRRHDSLEEALESSLENGWAEVVLASIARWRESIADFSAGELLYLAIKETGYLKTLLNEANDSIDAALSVQHLTDFFKLIKQFEHVSNKPNLIEFAQYLDDIKQSSVDVMSDLSPLDNDGVQLLTVHKAKGLEFDFVFLPELTEQNFPTYRQAEKIKLPNEILDPGKGDHYQEERRLFYVALTRARQGAELSFSSNHGGKRLKKPSRFIVESMGQNWQSQLKKPAMQRDISELIGSFEPVKVSHSADAMTARLFKGDWLYLTTNQIADYLRSPKEFWIFHILCLPKGPFHTLVYGSAVHAALEHYYKYRLNSRPIDLASVQKVFEESWRSEGFASKKHEETLFKLGKKVVSDYIKNHIQDAYKPVAIEQPFELQLPELKTVISGRYDIVLETKEGIEIRDFKTSLVKDVKAAEKKARSSVQLGIYALSWEKIQQKPIASTSLEFIQDLVLGKNTKIDHEGTLRNIKKAVEGIKNLHFDDKGQSELDFDKLVL